MNRCIYCETNIDEKDQHTGNVVDPFVFIEVKHAVDPTAFFNHFAHLSCQNYMENMARSASNAVQIRKELSEGVLEARREVLRYDRGELVGEN